MAKIKAFKGIRPNKGFAKAVASRPYDVLDSDEARKEAEGNEFSFLHVVKPEIDLPKEVDHYSPEVYLKGKENFQHFLEKKILFQDREDCLYLYQLTMGSHTQTGVVACASVDDYLNETIKKHELTRPDKEEDRKNHIRISEIHAEPVFFSYPAKKELDAIVEQLLLKAPEYDFTSDDGIIHRLWVINDGGIINLIVSEFEKIPSIYVADGHHRTAAAALVGKELREANPNAKGDEEYNYFLAVHFPDNQLKIIDYNRLVKDLNGLTAGEFLEKLKKDFDIKRKDSLYKPGHLHNFGLYLEGKWYSLTAKPGTYNNNDPIGVLDVTILSEKILAPILDIHDLRRDKRIDFVGGIRGLGELQKRVDSGEMKAAFALFPVTMGQLINISDNGKIMPPKTTWFEPKLRSGLVIHSLK
jgi:uncharacterized protein (DUF1015 family)